MFEITLEIRRVHANHVGDVPRAGRSQIQGWTPMADRAGPELTVTMLESKLSMWRYISLYQFIAILIILLPKCI